MRLNVRAIALVALFAAPATTQVVLEPDSLVFPGPDPSRLVLDVGDLNGDGLQDAVTASGLFLADLTVLLSQGDGTFSTSTFSSGSTLPDEIAVAHIDTDAHLDIVSSSSILMGNGDGTFGAPLPLVGGGFMAAAGHLDGDAFTDLVTVEQIVFTPDATLRVHHGDGRGGFTQVQSFTIILPREYELADFDEDGEPDLFIRQANVSRIYFGAGGGTFETSSTVLAVDSSRDHALADVDGDSHLDLVFATSLPSFGVSVLFGDGAGGFTPLFLDPPGIKPAAIAVADLDLDGALDIAVFDDDADHLSVLRGDGVGGFSLDLVLSQVDQSLVVADQAHAGTFDDDPFPDLLFTGQEGENLALRLVRNHSYAPEEPWADLGGDLAGTAGFPVFLGEGTLEAGTPFAWNLLQVDPGRLAFLVMGLSLLDAPFKGGVLKPSADVVVGPFPADGNGQVLIDGAWPALNGGYDVFMQYWIQDPAGPFGFAASPGLAVSVPDAP